MKNFIRDLLRGGGVDPPDQRVRRAPREGEGESPGEPHVVDVRIAALDELGVFEPLERAAHVLDRHQVCLTVNGRGMRNAGMVPRRKKSPQPDRTTTRG